MPSNSNSEVPASVRNNLPANHRGQVSTFLSQTRVDIGVADLLAPIPDINESVLVSVIPFQLKVDMK